MELCYFKDYDCDGTVTLRYHERGSCNDTAGFCSTTIHGWRGGVPGCGSTADWVRACDTEYDFPWWDCKTRTQGKTQQCR